MIKSKHREHNYLKITKEKNFWKRCGSWYSWITKLMTVLNKLADRCVRTCADSNHFPTRSTPTFRQENVNWSDVFSGMNLHVYNKAQLCRLCLLLRNYHIKHEIRHGWSLPQEKRLKRSWNNDDVAVENNLSHCNFWGKKTFFCPSGSHKPTYHLQENLLFKK